MFLLHGAGRGLARKKIVNTPRVIRSESRVPQITPQLANHLVTFGKCQFSETYLRKVRPGTGRAKKSIATVLVGIPSNGRRFNVKPQRGEHMIEGRGVAPKSNR